MIRLRPGPAEEKTRAPAGSPLRQLGTVRRQRARFKFVSNASAWGLIGGLARFGHKGGPLPADSSPRGNPKLCQWGPGVRGRVLTQISIKIVRTGTGYCTVLIVL